MKIIICIIILFALFYFSPDPQAIIQDAPQIIECRTWLSPNGRRYVHGTAQNGPMTVTIIYGPEERTRISHRTNREVILEATFEVNPAASKLIVIAENEAGRATRTYEFLGEYSHDETHQDEIQAVSADTH